MATRCYAMVRGSSIRVTELNARGGYNDPIRFATSKAVARVQVDEVSTSTDNETLRDEMSDELRLLLTESGRTIRHTIDIDFLRVDPGVLEIVAGVAGVRNAKGDIVGFDSRTKVPASTFGLEVWTKLAGNSCDVSGNRLWGYTVLPYLTGGHVSGFAFDGGLVSFNLVGAMTRRVPRWGVGPHDLAGYHERLPSLMERTTSIRSMIGPYEPPAEVDGVQTKRDIIDGQHVATSPDIIDGQHVVTSPNIIYGGRAV